jgi:hypothetical protein
MRRKEIHLKTPILIPRHFPKETQTSFRLQKATETATRRPIPTGSLKRSVKETQIRWEIPTEIPTHSAREMDSRIMIQKMIHLVIHLDSPMLMVIVIKIQKETLKLIQTGSHLPTGSSSVIHLVILTETETVIRLEIQRDSLRRILIPGVPKRLGFRLAIHLNSPMDFLKEIPTH